MKVKIQLDEKKRILKLCGGCGRWKVATTDHFPLDNKKLAATCYECGNAKRKAS